MPLSTINPDTLTVLKAIRDSRRSLNLDLDIVDAVLRTNPDLNGNQFEMLRKALDYMRDVTDVVSDLIESKGFAKKQEEGDF
jgi:hypothetical protein